MNDGEELQELVKKIVDNFAALNEDELYADSEKDLRELLERNKTNDFIWHSQLHEILSAPYHRLVEAENMGMMTVKETVLLNNLDELETLMIRMLDE